MIVPMSKYSFFVYAPEYHNFLLYLRDLGVVHIKERSSTKEVISFQNNRKQQEVATQLKYRTEMLQKQYPLEAEKSFEDIPHISFEDDIFSSFHSYKEAFDVIDANIVATEQQLQRIKSDLELLLPWGDFSATIIDKLTDSGFFFHFWSIDQSLYSEEWEQLHNAFAISSHGRYLYFVTVTRSSNPPELEGAELLHLPQGVSISSLEVEQRGAEEHLSLLKSSLAYLAHQSGLIDDHLIELKNEFNFDNANYQGNRLFDDQLIVLEGWVPKEKSDEMEQALQNSGSAYVSMEISEGEQAPIQLKNSRFARVFEPIVRMFSLPNYTELDPTAFIAPFFMLFFGICFGDAGYGLLVLVVATIIKAKKKEQSTKDILELAQWLGGAGFVIGFLSGSFFGIELPKVSFLAGIKDYFISSDNMMVIALVLGFVQIIFAKYIAAIKKTKQSGWKMALSSYAWPTIILLLAIIVVLPMANIQLPRVITYILYGIIGISALVILFYNSPGKNIFLNIGSALWQTYNTASGLLGDVLSYIRLFAIGLTGAILGQVFNSLALTASSGMHPILAFIVAGIILILGHGVNFGLTTIGALVHPIRLIFVEYFNNSDYEGGGEAYEPLRKLTPKQEEL